MSVKTDGAASALPDELEPDAHGQAAILLVESILHVLVDKGTLTNAEAMTAVEVAAEVKEEVAALSGESSGRMNESLDILTKIGASLETDQEM